MQEGNSPFRQVPVLYIVFLTTIALNWFKSYLTNRKQFVEIENYRSEKETISSGVPQGSILGPILFLLYINDLANLKIFGKLFSFVDDTSLLYKGNSISDILIDINKDLIVLNRWFVSNLLTINISKTNFMTFSWRKTINKEAMMLKFHSVSCTGTSNNCVCPLLERVEKVKYLGLHISQNLNWTNQITQLSNKIRKLIPKLYHLRNTFSIKTLKQIYYAFVHSQLQQNILVWGGTYKSIVDPLFKLQKASLKVIYKKKKTFSSQEIFAISDVLSLRNIFFYELIKDMHLKKDQIAQTDYKHLTRGVTAKNIKTPKFNLSASQRYVKFLGPLVYNKLPSILRTNLNTFQLKKHLKTYLMNLEDP